MDNLNTHREKSLTGTFGEREGRRLWARFTVHYTPKHGSWLNPAELEASLWSRQCHGRDRISALDELSRRTRAWNTHANRSHHGSIGVSPPPMRAACSVTNEALRLGRSTSF
jgi:hypothetical protein